jgi:hypothetical protein
MIALRNVALLIMIFSLSGCASHNDSMRAQGAGMGAVIGAGLGAIIGDNKKSAAVGAAVGSLLGFILGHEVALRKEQYATKEDVIVGETTKVAQLTQESRHYNQQLQQVIQENKQEITRLAAVQNQSHTGKRDLENQYKKVTQFQDNAKNSLVGLQNELNVQRKLYAEYKAKASQKNSGELTKWQTKIAQLEKEKQALQSNVETLMAMSPSI